MPVAPPRWCPTCRVPHYEACPVRKKQRWQDQDARRPSSRDRGYDEAWRRCRNAFLAANPLCKDCLDRGRYRAAEEVHHVVKVRDDPSRRLDGDNLMALCKPCHSARTARGGVIPPGGISLEAAQARGGAGGKSKPCNYLRSTARCPTRKDAQVSRGGYLKYDDH